MMSISHATFSLLTAARQRLAPEAAAQIGGFVAARQNPDGGFRGRGPGSDLYYTAFALPLLIALEAEFDSAAVARFLAPFDTGGELDLVHLCCLIRARQALAYTRLPSPARAALPFLTAILGRVPGITLPNAGHLLSPQVRQDYRQRILGFPNMFAVITKTPTSPFLDPASTCQPSPVNAPPPPPLYNTFMTVQALQDLDAASATATLSAWLHSQPVIPSDVTTLNAAAATLWCQTPSQVPRPLCQWLLDRQCRTGGFYGTAGAPVPDLLSTASALIALHAAAQLPDRQMTAAHLDFIYSLWDESGGFTGFPTDTTADIEYTFYAMAAIGALI